MPFLVNSLKIFYFIFITQPTGQCLVKIRTEYLATGRRKGGGMARARGWGWGEGRSQGLVYYGHQP